jgi:phage terminase small subunit
MANNIGGKGSSTSRNDNTPETLAEERRLLETRDEFAALELAEQLNRPLPKFMSRPEAFNNPKDKLRRAQLSALPFRLSPMQYKFAYEFIETGDAYNAYLAAGYSVGDKKPYQIRGKAKELLDTPKVNAFVEYIREKAMEKLVINIDDIVEKFLTTYNQAMASEDFTNANRALENLGKHLGMFVEKAMIEQKITMSTDQLDAEIAKYQGIIDAAINNPERTKH